MNISYHRRSASRVVTALYLLFSVSLLLVMNQFPGSAAVTAPERPGPEALWFSLLESDAPLASASLLIGPDVRLNSPEGAFTGPGGLSGFMATLRQSFSNLDFATTSTESVDNLVIVSFTMTGINTGSYHGLPPKCAGVAADGVAVLQFDGSRIREQWIGYDVPALHAQIDGFNLVEPSHLPTCNFVPDPVPAPLPESLDVPCVRRDRCDAWS